MDWTQFLIICVINMVMFLWIRKDSLSEIKDFTNEIDNSKHAIEDNLKKINELLSALESKAKASQKKKV